MKYIITESQLKTIMMEQGYSTDYERRELKKVDNQVAAQNKLGKLGPNLDADDYADIVSGLVDAVPGIGNLISIGIDVTHALTYVVRYFFAKTTEEKIEMSLLAVVTFASSLIPVGGNASNIAARVEVKSLLKKTPFELRVIMKNMGIIKSAGFNLAKEPWKYSFMIALVKIFKSKAADALAIVSSKLAALSNKSKELKPYIDDFNTQIKDVQTMLA
jgi:hypothetical protein